MSEASTQTIWTVVNSQEVVLEVDPRASAVDVIREDLGLTGTKLVCGAGVCGACTVLVDGRPTASCLMPACSLDGKDVRTVEHHAAMMLEHTATIDLARAAKAPVKLTYDRLEERGPEPESTGLPAQQLHVAPGDGLPAQGRRVSPASREVLCRSGPAGHAVGSPQLGFDACEPHLERLLEVPELPSLLHQLRELRLLRRHPPLLLLNLVEQQ